MLYSWRKPAFRDTETGVYNHTYFIEAFNREWQKHLSKQQGLALLYLRTNVDETPNMSPVIKNLSCKLKSRLLRNNDLIARHEKGYFTIGVFNVDAYGMKAAIQRVADAVEEVRLDAHHNYNQRFDCKITAGHCRPSNCKQSDGLFSKVRNASDNLAKQPKKQLEVIYWD